MATHLLVPFLPFYLSCPYPVNGTQLSDSLVCSMQWTGSALWTIKSLWLVGYLISPSAIYHNTSTHQISWGDSFLIITLVTLSSSYWHHRKPHTGAWLFWWFKKSSSSDPHFSEALQTHYAENQPEFPISFYRLSTLAKLFLFCLKLSLYLIIFITRKMLLGI